MSVHDDRIYLQFIHDRIERIQQFTQEGRDTFLNDIKTQDAVLRNLQTLAESTQRLSDALKDRNPQIPWRNIAGFRNVVVHNYLGLDLEHIWDIVARDLPSLAIAIEALLQAEASTESDTP